ncbi:MULTISPECIES: DUF1016 N-terminal domain-containing protein [unclassified Clostridium]|uniref:DUF1016 N-terminal domain-containing protein n=1 Tax=unclassified Clostridium TaxID=2614128 RepID=UPI00241F4605|nr:MULTISPECIES: DUF1016 N-terminal domain-containing protein [unclassified Clostridium]
MSQYRRFRGKNLNHMRRLAKEYPDIEFVQEVLAQITWYHTITLIEKVKDGKIRSWNIRKTIENGWILNVLAVK